jgi:hypothetical protein
MASEYIPFLTASNTTTFVFRFCVFHKPSGIRKTHYVSIIKYEENRIMRLNVNGRTILKRILKQEIDLVQDAVQWVTLLSMQIKRQIP